MLAANPGRGKYLKIVLWCGGRDLNPYGQSFP
jgi:hypothetical protein